MNETRRYQRRVRITRDGLNVAADVNAVVSIGRSAGADSRTSTHIVQKTRATGDGATTTDHEERGND